MIISSEAQVMTSRDVVRLQFTNLKSISSIESTFVTLTLSVKWRESSLRMIRGINRCKTLSRLDFLRFQNILEYHQMNKYYITLYFYKIIKNFKQIIDIINIILVLTFTVSFYKFTCCFGVYWYTLSSWKRDLLKNNSYFS